MITSFPSAVGLSPASVIAALSSQVGVLAARSLSKPQCARFWPLISQDEGPVRLIVNLRGAIFKAPRSLSFRTLFQSPEKPLSVASIFCRPSPFVATAHDEQHATKEIPNVGKAYRRIGNV